MNQFVMHWMLQDSNESLWNKTGPFTTYGLLVAGPVTHYFYNFLEKILGSNIKGKVLFERLVFCPTFLVVTLYVLERLKVRTWIQIFFSMIFYCQSSDLLTRVMGMLRDGKIWRNCTLQLWLETGKSGQYPNWSIWVWFLLNSGYCLLI